MSGPYRDPTLNELREKYEAELAEKDREIEQLVEAMGLAQERIYELRAKLRRVTDAIVSALDTMGEDEDKTYSILSRALSDTTPADTNTGTDSCQERDELLQRAANLIEATFTRGHVYVGAHEWLADYHRLTGEEET